jgi:hypothetical protein
MGRIVPTYLQAVCGREPVRAIPFQLTALPLFHDAQIRAVFQIDNQAQRLVIQFKGHDARDLGGLSLLNFKQTISRQHKQFPLSYIVPVGQCSPGLLHLSEHALQHCPNGAT